MIFVSNWDNRLFGTLAFPIVPRIPMPIELAGDLVRVSFFKMATFSVHVNFCRFTRQVSTCTEKFAGFLSACTDYLDALWKFSDFASLREPGICWLFFEVELQLGTLPETIDFTTGKKRPVRNRNKKKRKLLLKAEIGPDAITC